MAVCIPLRTRKWLAHTHEEMLSGAIESIWAQTVSSRNAIKMGDSNCGEVK